MTTDRLPALLAGMDLIVHEHQHRLRVEARDEHAHREARARHGWRSRHLALITVRGTRTPLLGRNGGIGA